MLLSIRVNSHSNGVAMRLYSVISIVVQLFLSVLDELVEFPAKGDSDAVLSKIASMSCKAAVKGNHRLTDREANELIDQLLRLAPPYTCPHGRPTIISMSKYEMEKKFKRIV